MLYELIYMWNLKTNTNKPIHETQNRLTYIENKLTVTKGERVWGVGGGVGINLEFGINRYTLLCIKLINNIVIPFSLEEVYEY